MRDNKQKLFRVQTKFAQNNFRSFCEFLRFNHERIADSAFFQESTEGICNFDDNAIVQFWRANHADTGSVRQNGLSEQRRQTLAIIEVVEALESLEA